MPRKLVEVETDQYGIVKLRGVTLGDIDFYSGIDHTISSRELTAIVIHRQLLSPKLAESDVVTWSDSLLQMVSSEWAKVMLGEHWQPTTQDSTYDDFRRGFEAKLAAWEEAIEKSGKIIAENIQNLGLVLIQPHILDGIQKLRSELIQPFITQRVQPIFSGLLDSTLRLFSEQIRQVVEAVRPAIEAMLVAQEMDEGGYGFFISAISWGEAEDMGDILRVSPKIRRALITRRLYALTCSEDFETTLREGFENSSLLKKRWPAIASALARHRSRDYYSSIPTLLPQVEGILTDILRLRKEVTVIHGKLYAIDKNGKPKLNKKGDRIQVSGLGQLLQNSELADDDSLGSLAVHITDRLVTERHSIVHGRKPKYAQSKLSTQLLLMLYVLSGEMLYLEGLSRA